MSEKRRPTPPILAAVGLSLLLAACSGAGADPSPTAPGASPTPAASDSDDLEHETGATDVLLRYEDGGGFMMAEFAATMVPHFTLYGDGTVIFRDPSDEAPPAEGSVFKAGPLKVAKLTEEQIQDLLKYALDEGGLAGARAQYTNDTVADASTTTFTISAEGQTKTVSIYALGLELEGMADAAPRAAFLKLAETLVTIDEGGTVSATPYVPTAYRGVLLEAPGIVAPDTRDWPWDDIAVEDFVVDPDPNGMQLPTRVMTAEEIEAIGIDDYEGGFQNMVVRAPGGGATYTFSLRPLLPDESK